MRHSKLLGAIIWWSVGIWLLAGCGNVDRTKLPEQPAQVPYTVGYEYNYQGNNYRCIWAVDGRRGGLWCENVTP